MLFAMTETQVQFAMSETQNTLIDNNHDHHSSSKKTGAKISLKVFVFLFVIHNKTALLFTYLFNFITLFSFLCRKSCLD